MLNSIETLVLAGLNGEAGAFALPMGSANGSATKGAIASQPVAFVDSSLANVDALITSLENVTVYRIEAHQDGMSYIGTVLAQLNGPSDQPARNSSSAINSVHIFTHGRAGALQLGSTTLTADNLNGYSEALSRLAQSQTGDVLLYGCDVAQGETGNAFINQLVALSGADIQASNDVTGSAQRGGDWDLEIAIGRIETGIAISAAGQARYQGTLASPQIITNGGGDTAAVVVNEGDLLVTDVDTIGANGYSESSGLEYYFSGGQDSYLFDIDANTGVVSFKSAPNFNRPLDTNRNNIYDINILAIDWTGQSDTQAISVTVQDVGVSAPFEIVNSTGGDLSAVSVNEGMSAVLNFDVAGATDGLSEGNGVEYYFQGGQDAYLFNLDVNTGQLSFKDAPDYERPLDANGDNRYEVGVVAIDYAGQSDTQLLSIALSDVEEAPGNAPFIISSGGNAYATTQIEEGTSIVVDMAVMDADGQTEGNGITYSIQGGIDGRWFNIDANTGLLSFKTAPDFGAPVDAGGDNIYGVEVFATDSTGRFDRQFIDVQVSDRIERPVISSNGGGETAVIELNENAIAVTDVNATAANGFGEGNGFTYTLSTGDDAGLFNINATTGVISFQTAPDFETPTDADANNVYIATVLVQDPTGQSDTQRLSVVVKNVTEAVNMPVITSGGGNDAALVKVKEGSDWVVDMQTVDADGDTEGNGIVYVINAGADAALFDIDPNTGVISFRATPDYEAPADADLNNIYLINVLAFDSSGRADSQFIQVEVTNRVSLYLLGGQSNMAGDTSNASFLAGTPQGSPLPAVQIWQPGFNSFVDLRPGFQNNFGVSTGFGAEIGFGHTLEAARANGTLDSEEIYLVKYAIGSTNLAVDWNVDGTGNRYDEFTQWVGGALANLANAGIDYSIEGMLWMQGENDAANASYAANYQSNLTHLISDVRSRYGADIDFVIGRLHEELTPFFYTEADVVRTAQANVAAADPHNYLVNTDSFTVNPIDGVHFDSSGHLALGNAFANVFIR